MSETSDVRSPFPSDISSTGAVRGDSAVPNDSDDGVDEEAIADVISNGGGLSGAPLARVAADTVEAISEAVESVETATGVHLTKCQRYCVVFTLSVALSVSTFYIAAYLKSLPE